MLILSFFIILNVHVECFRFEESNVELWYQIPVSVLYPSIESDSSHNDSIMIKYSYKLDLSSTAEADTGRIEGTKGAIITKKGSYEEFDVVDYLTMRLYSGVFTYTLTVITARDTIQHEGTLDIPDVSQELWTSDIILGKTCDPLVFRFRGHPFIPQVDKRFTLFDTLYSYLELYNLRPDSLFYTIRYTVYNNNKDVLVEKTYSRLRYGYAQKDTFLLYLGTLVDGQYLLTADISDENHGTVISSQAAFFIETPVDVTAGMKFYTDIRYFVSDGEFKKYTRMNDQDQRLYLKAFWSEHDYWDYERRILESDEKFSMTTIQGRDTHRGRYYIKYGPPDFIEKYPLIKWARPLELWRYFTQGKDVLFCDTEDDANPRFIVELTIGELTRILEFGISDKDAVRKWPWIIDIAPGVYYGQDDKDD